MRRKHSRMMAIILSTIILAGCSNSSHLSVSQTHSSPSATAQPRPTAEPLAVSVSPERSCYQQTSKFLNRAVRGCVQPCFFGKTSLLLHNTLEILPKRGECESFVVW